jgi:GDP-L-fucose synthase
MDLNVMEGARISGVKKVIMSLSSGMYSPDSFLCSEQIIHDGPPHESNYSYAFAKRLIDPMIRSYREEYGLNAIGLVPNGIFGEHDYFGAEDSNMLAALISKFFRAMCTGEDVVIWGDGSQLRELTYGRDLARAYMWALENYDEGQILNVGNTEEYSVLDIVTLLAYFMKIDSSRITNDPTKPTGPYRKPTDNSRFLGLSGFEYTPFSEALMKTVNWYINAKPGEIRTGSKVRS